MDKIKAFFATLGQSLKDNALHVVSEYPYTSSVLVLVGFVAGAWVL